MEKCKQRGSHFEIIYICLCGKRKLYTEVARFWKNVTCKECLKYKNIPLHERNKILSKA